MRWDVIIAGGLIVLGLVVNGSLTRYSSAASAFGGSVWVTDGLTGDTKICFSSNRIAAEYGAHDAQGCIASGVGVR